MEIKMDPWPTVNVPTEYGSVQLAFTEAGHVCVTDQDSFTYRGTAYRIRVHLYANSYANSSWGTRDASVSYNTITKVSGGADAPRTYRSAIINALTETVRAFVAENPDILRLAEYTDAEREVRRAMAEAAELAAKLDAVNAELAAARKRMDDNRPATVQ